jgi:hypothetical protein
MNTNYRFAMISIWLVSLLLIACAPAAAPVISIEGAWGKQSADYPTAGWRVVNADQKYGKCD